MPYASTDKSIETIAGIVLAGGKSSRMGKDKALMDFNGQTMLDHMINLLRSSGLKDIRVSGDYTGYDCISDPVDYPGPAAAIKRCMDFMPDHGGLVFVPVDMPFLSPDSLKNLLRFSQGAYYVDKLFPAFIPQQKIENDFTGRPVMALFEAVGLKGLEIPQGDETSFANINTPEDWQKLVAQ